MEKESATRLKARGAVLKMTLKSIGAHVKPTGSLIHSRPQKATAHCRRRASAPRQCPELSVSGIDLVHCGQLFGRCCSLKFFFPGLIRHAVDSFAAFVLA